MFSKIKFLFAPSLLLLPVLAFAQTDGINALLSKIQVLVGRLVPTLIGLALLLFLWGVLKYFFSKDAIAQKEARSFMLWGILALFVMVSVWGLVRVVGETVFGTNVNNVNQALPTPDLPR